MDKKIALPKFNLQLFAEDTPEETLPTDEKIEGEETKTEAKTFTQEDVDNIIAKRLNRDRAKWEQEFKDKLAEEKEEAEELAKLSEKERNKAILDKERKEFETERIAFKREKIELEVTKNLASKGLPVEFAGLLVKDTAEESLDNISKFEEKWQESLSKAVDDKLKGTSPTRDATDVSNSQVSSLGKRLAEQREQTQEIIKENPYF